MPRMPPSFQQKRIKSFSLGHEHTLALDRHGQSRRPPCRLLIIIAVVLIIIIIMIMDSFCFSDEDPDL